LEDIVFILASTIAKNQPELVSTSLSHIISSDAFPWNLKADIHSFQYNAQSVVKDYVKTLYMKNNDSYPDNGNNFKLNCESASKISSQMLSLQFDSFNPHIPIIINYILVQLNDSLNNEGVKPLLRGLIYGYISYLHSSNSVNSDIYPLIKEDLSKILGWLEMADARVVWILERDMELDSPLGTRISVDTFVEMLLGIFEHNCPKIRQRILRECVSWASEGFLVLYY
jgi:hypothetical protein